LSFEYKSEVKWEKVVTYEPKQTVLFDDDSGEVPFTQTFKITNKGPSPTQEKTQLKIYIPETILDKSKHVQIIDGKNCTKDVTGMIDLAMSCKGAKEVISCRGITNCAPYTCNIDGGWSKGKSYEINVPMSFSAKDAKHSAYTVCVHAKVEGTNEAITGNRKLESKEAGPTKSEKKLWPIIVGIVIVCIVAAITAIAMYKTGTFSKFRFFKMEDPDEVGLEEDEVPGEKEPVELL